MTAKKGTFLIEDTRGLHKGSGGKRELQMYCDDPI